MSPHPSFSAPLSHFTSGFQSSVRHHRLGLWWLNLWRRLWGFTLELRWSQRNVPRTTLDIWYLKMILPEFRISMPTDSTSVVMQLTCHSAQSNHSLVRARFMIVHVIQGETEFFKDSTLPGRSPSNSETYQPDPGSSCWCCGRGCRSRSGLFKRSCGHGIVLQCCPVWQPLAMCDCWASEMWYWV